MILLVGWQTSSHCLVRNMSAICKCSIVFINWKKKSINAIQVHYEGLFWKVLPLDVARFCSLASCILLVWCSQCDCLIWCTVPFLCYVLLFVNLNQFLTWGIWIGKEATGKRLMAALSSSFPKIINIPCWIGHKCLNGCKYRPKAERIKCKTKWFQLVHTAEISWYMELWSGLVL